MREDGVRGAVRAHHLPCPPPRTWQRLSPAGARPACTARHPCARAAAFHGRLRSRLAPSTAAAAPPLGLQQQLRAGLAARVASLHTMVPARVSADWDVKICAGNLGQYGAPEVAPACARYTPSHTPAPPPTHLPRSVPPGASRPTPSAVPLSAAPSILAPPPALTHTSGAALRRGAPCGRARCTSSPAGLVGRRHRCGRPGRPQRRAGAGGDWSRGGGGCVQPGDRWAGSPAVHRRPALAPARSSLCAMCTPYYALGFPGNP
jgi:hypothetical protein